MCANSNHVLTVSRPCDCIVPRAQAPATAIIAVFASAAAIVDAASADAASTDAAIADAAIADAAIADAAVTDVASGTCCSAA